jgi:hypothetical protein
MLVLSDYYAQQLLLALTNHTVAGNFDGPLRGALAGLFINNVAINKNTLLAALAEATYTNYARQAITWTAPIRDLLGNVSMNSQLLNWIPSDAVTPNNVYGIFVVDSGGTHLLAGEVFPNPVGLIDALSYLGTVIEYMADNPQGAGTILVG